MQLYLNFEGKVWKDAEVLDQSRLARPGGVGFLVQWVQRTYGEAKVREEQREKSDKMYFLEDLEPDGDDSDEETEDEDVMEAMAAFRGATDGS
ncbi:MAG: hypothetical protein ACKPB3_03430, partial [Bacteroidota bacterium]